MKKTATLIFAAFIVSILSVAAQNPASKSNTVGKWKFDAPYAPEGYNSGLIEVSFAENKYSALISFTGSDYKIAGEKVKVENDTVNFTVYIEGNDIAIKLKMDGDAKMAGKAVYVEGEIPLTLTREVKNQ